MASLPKHYLDQWNRILAYHPKCSCGNRFRVGWNNAKFIVIFECETCGTAPDYWYVKTPAGNEMIWDGTHEEFKKMYGNVVMKKLKAGEDGVCVCDITDLMIGGCHCGGFAKEKARGGRAT